MPFGYTAAHCEWLGKYAYTDEVMRPSSFEILLYDDESDELGFHADLADIESEPSDGNYERATLSFPSDLTTINGDRGTAVHPIEATFDFQGVTGEVDSVGVVWACQLADDSAVSDHLMVREQLDDREDLADRKGQYTVGVNWRVESRY